MSRRFELEHNAGFKRKGQHTLLPYDWKYRRLGCNGGTHSDKLLTRGLLFWNIKYFNNLKKKVCQFC